MHQEPHALSSCDEERERERSAVVGRVVCGSKMCSRGCPILFSVSNFGARLACMRAPRPSLVGGPPSPVALRQQRSLIHSLTRVARGKQIALCVPVALAASFVFKKACNEFSRRTPNSILDPTLSLPPSPQESSFILCLSIMHARASHTRRHVRCWRSIEEEDLMGSCSALVFCGCTATEESEMMRETPSLVSNRNPIEMRLMRRRGLERRTRTRRQRTSAAEEPCLHGTSAAAAAASVHASL